MKIDIKTLIIIFLVGVIGVMAGILVGRSSNPSAPAQSNVPVDDGKLAKEYKKTEIMKVIRENARSIQECYLTFLDGKPAITEGVIRFVMTLREDGSVIKARIVKNEFQNIPFADCVQAKVEKLYFAPPPLGINRNIGHDLAFKSEETARKEAEQARKRNMLPKVLPVSPDQMNRQ